MVWFYVIARYCMMKNPIAKQVKHLILCLIAIALMAFPASAAGVRGKITSIDSGSISGWAWNPDNTNDVQNVEIHIFQAGKAEPIQYLHVTADKYREDLVADLKDGWHGFRAEVNWSQFNCSDFKVKAYVVKDGSYYLLGDAVSYSRTSGSSSKAPASSVKPAAQPATQVTMVQPPSSAPTGASPQLVPISNTETPLGIFSISGYCGCDACGSGTGLTYSGVIAQANHTIAADLSILPLGSKVRVGNVIYTVEDMGSGIQGKMLDIYYNSHEEAMAHGRTQQEVYLVQ